MAFFEAETALIATTAALRIVIEPYLFIVRATASLPIALHPVILTPFRPGELCGADI
jgi:hypothetical protein